MEYTVFNLSIWSHLGLHYLLTPVCPNTHVEKVYIVIEWKPLEDMHYSTVY